jgi:outer membrane protein assembly factor BamB
MPRRYASLALLGTLTAGTLLLPSLAADQRAAEWPQFRGPGGLGVSADTGLPVTWSERENLAWKTELPGPGTSSPVVVGPRLFLTCYSGYNVPGQAGSPDGLKLHVVCIDRTDGKVRWVRDVKAKLPEQVTIREGHGYASNTPAADGERVYVFFGKSGVLAFDHDGNRLWQADVGERLNGWGSAASPVLFGNLVIVNASVESDSLVALDCKTGKEVWRAGGIREAWNTPLLVPLGGKTELVVAIFRKVLGFDPESGQQLWTCDTGIDWYMVPSLVAHEGVVYGVGGRSGGAFAVRAGGRGDVTQTHRLWTGGKGSNVASPVYHDGRLYWMHENLGIAYCAEARTGTIVYEERVDRLGQVYAPALLAGGRLYYVSRSGRTLVLAAGPKFEQLAVNDLRDGSTFNAGFAVAGGRLYLRSNRFLSCLGKK